MLQINNFVNINTAHLFLMMLFYLLRLGLCLGCLVGFGAAQADLLTNNMPSLSELQNISILEDKQGDMGFEQASHPENAALYKPWPVDQGQINSPPWTIHKPMN